MIEPFRDAGLAGFGGFCRNSSIYTLYRHSYQISVSCTIISSTVHFDYRWTNPSTPNVDKGSPLTGIGYRQETTLHKKPADPFLGAARERVRFFFFFRGAEIRVSCEHQTDGENE